MAAAEEIDMRQGGVLRGGSCQQAIAQDGIDMTNADLHPAAAALADFGAERDVERKLITLPLVGRVGEQRSRSGIRETGWG
jgi:hypothetical protein